MKKKILIISIISLVVALLVINIDNKDNSDSVADIVKEKKIEAPMAYFHNNSATTTEYATFLGGLGTAYTASITCEKGSTAILNASNNVEFTHTVIPDYCYINFQDIEYTVTVNVTNGSSSPENKTTTYNATETFTITPSSYYNLENVTYSCTNASSTFDSNTGILTVSNITDNSVCSVSTTLNSYALAIGKTGSGTVSPESTTITYGGTRAITVSPSTGYYISAGSCNNGYTITGLTTGTSATSSQNVTINNANHDNGDSCTFTFSPRSYTVTGSASGSGTVSSSTVTYGNTTQITITPSSGNYLSAFSCTNNYTYSGVSTGSSYTSAQVATINNNSQNNDATCTATFAATSCTVTKTASNGMKADYNCVNGTGTMTTCRYGSVACNGGYSGEYSYFYLCTLNESYTGGNLYSRCNTKLSDSISLKGGGLTNSISCSC